MENHFSLAVLVLSVGVRPFIGTNARQLIVGQYGANPIKSFGGIIPSSPTAILLFRRIRITSSREH